MNLCYQYGVYVVEYATAHFFGLPKWIYVKLDNTNLFIHLQSYNYIAQIIPICLFIFKVISHKLECHMAHNHVPVVEALENKSACILPALSHQVAVNQYDEPPVHVF